MKYIIILLLAITVGCTKKSDSPSPSVVSSSLQSSGDGNFGIVPYGDLIVKSFVYTNDSQTAVNLNPEITGVQSSAFQQVLNLGCTTLEIRKKCLVKVMFNSSNKESGTYSANLVVGDSTISLSAEVSPVSAVSYEISINNDLLSENHDLGLLQGKEIKLLSVKVKNNSPRIGSSSTLSSSNNRFQILASNCVNRILKPSQSCTAKVIVKGNNTDEDLQTEFSFDNKQLTLNLNSEVQNLPSNLTAMMPDIMMGDLYEEKDKKIQAIVIINQGSGVGSIESLTLPPEFSLASNNCQSVKPGAKCVIRLVFNSSSLDKGQHSSSIDLGDSEVELMANRVSNPNDLQLVEVIVPYNIPVGNCQAVSINLKDSANLDFVSSSDTILSSSQTLYSDSNCSVNDNLTIPSFESSKNVFIKNLISGNSSLSITAQSKTNTINLFFFAPLELTIDKSHIVTGSSAQVSIAGGKPPFVLEKLSGDGSIAQNGLYTSGAVGSILLKVTDSLGFSSTVSTEVVSILTTNTLSFVKHVNQAVSVNGIGGLPPYAYSIKSGVGSVNSSSGDFISATGGLTQISVKDALNQEVIISGDIRIASLNGFTFSSDKKKIVVTGTDLHLINTVKLLSPYAQIDNLIIVPETRTSSYMELKPSQNLVIKSKLTYTLRLE